MSNKYTVADFFCGAGGFSEGFHQAGFDVIFSLDNWKLAIETHKLNHPRCNSVVKNILELNTPEKIDEVVPDTDIIIGSPPCVSFSNSNKSGKADNTLGNELMKSYLRIILYKQSKPNSKLKYWVLENVENSKKFFEIKQDNGKSFNPPQYKLSYSCSDLDLPELNTKLIINNSNYTNEEFIKISVLNANDYGTPQNRKRLILGNYIKPEKNHNKLVIKNVLDNLGNPLNKVEINDEKINDLYFTNIQFSKIFLTDHFYDSTIPECMWKKSKRLKTDHGYMGKMSFPEDINKPSRTVMATESSSTRESIILCKENSENQFRCPTIRELACFMGFPINYQFKGTKTNKHKQIGNAVCVPLSYNIGKAIMNKLNEDELNDKIKSLDVNLNNLEKPIFDGFVEKEKKFVSKYHRHPPYIKLNSFRVELSNNVTKNSKDEFEVKWISEIHKGAGEHFLKCQFDNEKLIKFLEKDSVFENFKKNIDDKFKDIKCPKLFQEKFCLINSNQNNYLSPDDCLEYISSYISKNSNLIYDRDLEVPELTKMLDKNNKKLKSKKKDNNYKFPLPVLYSLYAVNKLCLNMTC